MPVSKYTIAKVFPSFAALAPENCILCALVHCNGFAAQHRCPQNTHMLALFLLQPKSLPCRVKFSCSCSNHNKTSVHPRTICAHSRTSTPLAHISNSARAIRHNAVSAKCPAGTHHAGKHNALDMSHSRLRMHTFITDLWERGAGRTAAVFLRQRCF